MALGVLLSTFASIQAQGDVPDSLERASVPVQVSTATVATEPAGTIDPAFPAGTGPDGEVKALSIQRDGRIFVGGDFSSYNAEPAPGLVRINSDGGVDRSFDATKTLAVRSSIAALALQADGRILVAGLLTNYDGIALPGVVRLESNGTLDPSFNATSLFLWPDHVVAPGQVPTLALQSDGKILLGGLCMRLNADGSEDLGFKADLWTAPEFPSGVRWQGWVTFISEVPDHKILIAGRFQENLAQLNSNGTLDSTFQISRTPVFYAGRQPDGKILVNILVMQSHLSRLNSDGSADASFQGGSLDGAVLAAQFQADNKIVIGGTFGSYEGAPRRGIARLQPDGLIDTTFDPGTGVNGDSARFNALALESNDNFLVGGLFSGFNGVQQRNLVRLRGGMPMSPPVIAVQPKSQVIMAGQSVSFSVKASSFEHPSYQWTFQGNEIPNATNDVLSLTRVQANGAGKYAVVVRNSRGPTVSAEAILTVLDLAAPVIEVQPADQHTREGATIQFTVGATSILPLSYQWQFNGQNLVAATNSSLSLTNVHLRDAGVYRVVVRHELLSTNSSPARLTVEAASHRPGTVDIDFAPHGDFGQPSTILLSTDGEIMVAGRSRLVRLDPDGEPDPVFNPIFGPEWVSSLGGISKPILEFRTLLWDKDGRLLVGGAFSEVNGLPYNCIVRLNTDGMVDPTLAAGTGVRGVPGGIGYTYIEAIGIQGNGKLVVSGAFSGLMATSQAYCARINADGSPDPNFALPFTVDGNRGFNVKMASLPNGKLFLALAGYQPGALARLEPDGSIDQSFNSRLRGVAADGQLTALAPAPDGRLLVGGTFTHIDDQPRNNVARLLENGEVDATFDPGLGPDGLVEHLAVQTDGKILVAGRFSSFDGQPRRLLTRLNASGRVDPTFNPTISFGSVGANPITALQVQVDGRVLLSGDFERVDDLPRQFLVRLFGDPLIALENVRFHGSRYSLALPTVPGVRYSLEWTDSLLTPNWLGQPAVTGDGSLQALEDPAATGAQKFYRLRLEWPTPQPTAN